MIRPINSINYDVDFRATLKSPFKSCRKANKPLNGVNVASKIKQISSKFVKEMRELDSESKDLMLKTAGLIAATGIIFYTVINFLSKIVEKFQNMFN